MTQNRTEIAGLDVLVIDNMEEGTLVCFSDYDIGISYADKEVVIWGDNADTGYLGEGDEVTPGIAQALVEHGCKILACFTESPVLNLPDGAAFPLIYWENKNGCLKYRDNSIPVEEESRFSNLLDVFEKEGVKRFTIKQIPQTPPDQDEDNNLEEEIKEKQEEHYKMINNKMNEHFKNLRDVWFMGLEQKVKDEKYPLSAKQAQKVIEAGGIVEQHSTLWRYGTSKIQGVLMFRDDGDKTWRDSQYDSLEEKSQHHGHRSHKYRVVKWPWDPDEEPAGLDHWLEEDDAGYPYEHPELEVEKEEGKMITCPKCKGRGFLYIGYPMAPQDRDVDDTCPICDGEGRLTSTEVKNFSHQVSDVSIKFTSKNEHEAERKIIPDYTKSLKEFIDFCIEEQPNLTEVSFSISINLPDSREAS